MSLYVKTTTVRIKKTCVICHPLPSCIIRKKTAYVNLLRQNGVFFLQEKPVLQDKDLGLAIGNLTSQLYANFYLDPFDHYLEDTLGFVFHGRYVDDFYIVDEIKTS